MRAQSQEDHETRRGLTAQLLRPTIAHGTRVTLNQFRGEDAHWSNADEDSTRLRARMPDILIYICVAERPAFAGRAIWVLGKVHSRRTHRTRPEPRASGENIWAAGAWVWYIAPKISGWVGM